MVKMSIFGALACIDAAKTCSVWRRLFEHCVCVQVWVLVCVKERLRQSVCCWVSSRLTLGGPEGRPGMYDGHFPPVWNLRTVFWFPFPISSLLFLLSSSCSFCLVIFLLVHSPDFFLSRKYFSLRVRRVFFFWYGSCWVARRWQLVDSMCSLLPFATGIYHYALCNMIFFSVHFFIINKLEWLMIPACPGLMCSFNKGNTEGTNSSKICIWCLCMYVLRLQSDCGSTWQKSFEMCICLWHSLTVLRWPSVVDRTSKANTGPSQDEWEMKRAIKGTSFVEVLWIACWCSRTLEMCAHF